MKSILRISILFSLMNPLISFSLEPILGGKINKELIAKVQSENLKLKSNRMPASLDDEDSKKIIQKNKIQ